MFLTININAKKYPKKTVEATIKNKARKFVYLCQIGTTEKLLNRYLVKNYKVSLKRLCVNLIDKSQIQIMNDHITITFKTANQDKLASFITYGNGIIQGSDILRNAFKYR